jgi:peptidoglycan/xylan/chitin deacetylase (PgdA/CDA1 family)
MKQISTREIEGLDALSTGAPDGDARDPIMRANPSKVLTIFASGHGWTLTNGGASSDLNATDFVTRGAQSAKVQSAGTTFIEKTGQTPIDASGQSFRVVFRLDSYSNLSAGGVVLYAGDDTFTNYYQWTIMNSEAAAGWQLTRGGEWVTVDLSFADAVAVGTPNRGALTATRLRLAASSTRLAWFNEVSLVPEQTLFPNGVVSLVFDDCDLTSYTNAAPVMDKHGFSGTMFAIRDVVDGAGSLTLEQLKSLERDRGWEVAAHCDTLATHQSAGGGYVGLDSASQLADMRANRAWLAANGFKALDHMAYPHGDFDPGVLDNTRKVFATGRTTVRRTHHETLPPADPYRIRCIEVLNTDTPAGIQAEIDKAFTNRSWLILLFHTVGSTASSVNWSTADFTTVVDYLKTKTIPVRNYGDVLESLSLGLDSATSTTTVATDAIFDAKGDLPVGTGADASARLPVGSDGEVLTADSTQPKGMKWAAPSGTPTTHWEVVLYGSPLEPVLNPAGDDWLYLEVPN